MISIIVPACGQVALTRRCVESIRQHTDESYEIVLIDNGSTAKENDELARLQGRIQYVRYPQMLGYPAAINAGVRAATGEYLCLMNNDAAFTGPWAKRLLAGLAHGDIISPIVDNIGQATQRLGDPWAPGRLAAVGMLFFVCVVLRRQLFDEFGGLSERYGLGNGEDVEFCEAVKARGGTLLVEPAVFVRHQGSATFLEKLGTSGYRQLLEANHRLREGNGHGE